MIGTVVSVCFLYAIALLNLATFRGIWRLFGRMRGGHSDEVALNEQLSDRGLINRLVARAGRPVERPWHMYVVGLLFGLGFDTATEIALLAAAGTASATGVPWYAILCLPILFAAGMSLFDTLDGTFMNIRLRLVALAAVAQGVLQPHAHRTHRSPSRSSSGRSSSSAYSGRPWVSTTASWPRSPTSTWASSGSSSSGSSSSPAVARSSSGGTHESSRDALGVMEHLPHQRSPSRP